MPVRTTLHKPFATPPETLRHRLTKLLLRWFLTGIPYPKGLLVHRVCLPGLRPNEAAVQRYRVTVKGLAPPSFSGHLAFLLGNGPLKRRNSGLHDLEQLRHAPSQFGPAR
jgi:hypothetical protein